MKLKIAAVRDILRYRQLGLSYSEIANTIGCSKSSVKKYIDRAVANNAEHSVAAALSDSSLGDILQPRQRNLHGQIDPDWQAVFLEHTQKDFSLKELWQNYVELVGEEHALKYSAFCENYRKFVKTLPDELVDGYLALEWTPGEYVQIDYSGDGIEMVDADGVVSEAQIFVAVLPYSSYIFVYATPDQSRDSWLDALIMLFRHLDGVPPYMQLDNSRSLVLKGSKFNPLLSKDFKNFCQYYGIVADAVNPYSPRQKGAVENAVNQVQRSIIKPLQGVRFFNIEQVNARLVSMLEELNNKPMVGRAGLSRKELVLRELPLLHELPKPDFELSMIIKTLTVRKDGCIRLGNARYSVPHQIIGKKVEVRILPRAAKVIIRLDGVTLREDKYRQPAEPTIYRKMEHLTPAQQYVLMPPSQMIEKIAQCGPQAEGFCKYLHEHIATPLLKRQLRGCLYLMSKTGPTIFEQCCRKALESVPVNFDALQQAVNTVLTAQESKKPVIGNNKHRMPRKTAKSTFRGAEYYRDAPKEDKA